MMAKKTSYASELLDNEGMTSAFFNRQEMSELWGSTQALKRSSKELKDSVTGEPLVSFINEAGYCLFNKSELAGLRVRQDTAGRQYLLVKIREQELSVSEVETLPVVAI
jgi:chromosome segregation and condensation protein ScpB